MGAAGIELPDFVTPKTVEAAQGWMLKRQEANDSHVVRVALRAAHDRNPWLMKALDKGSEVLHALSESQLGKTYNVGGLRIDATEFQMWREAFRWADKGEPMAQFSWQYVAAARLAGLL